MRRYTTPYISVSGAGKGRRALHSLHGGLGPKPTDAEIYDPLYLSVRRGPEPTDAEIYDPLYLSVRRGRDGH